MDGNPFRFATPVGSDALVGRDQDAERLLQLVDSGTYVMLEAPRRYGKTSLLTHCARMWRRRGGLAIWVDFSRVLTAEEAARRLEAALGEDHGEWQAAVADLLRSMRLRLGAVELGGARPAPAEGERLHELLEVAARAARSRRRRSLVCLDEFQDVLAVSGLDGLLRSHVQHHAEHVSYVFSGSEPSLLRSLFAERGRPLYAQAKPLRLGPIAAEPLHAHIVERFAAAGIAAASAAETVVAVTGGHPQRTMLLAWHLWDRADGQRPLDGEDAAAATEHALLDALPEFEATWRGLAGNERRVATALALGLAPHGKQATARTGMASGSAAQRALAGLRNAGVADRQAAALTDPLFAVWLRAEHGG